MKYKSVKAKPGFKQLMSDKDITVGELAYTVKCSQATLTRFRNGKTCSIGLARSIAKALEVNVEDISEVVYIEYNNKKARKDNE